MRERNSFGKCMIMIKMDRIIGCRIVREERMYLTLERGRSSTRKSIQRGKVSREIHFA